MPPSAPGALRSPYHPSVADVGRLKRLLLGRALQTEQAGRDSGRLGALTAVGSDALSSNVYATQEILIILALGGFGLYAYGPAVAACVVVVFIAVVAAYRYTVREYPGGGADYEVAHHTLGPTPAVVVAAAMLIDFALTLAVSTTALLDTVISVVPGLFGGRVPLAIAVIAALTLLSLRGGSATSTLLRVGTWGFIAMILLTAVVGAVLALFGETPRAVSADWQTTAGGAGLAGLGLLLVLARAFSSGSTAVTGVEAVGTSAPTLRRPRGEHAAAALVLIGSVSMLLFASITWLALITGVRVTADNDDLIGLPEGEPQQTVVVQVVDAVFGTPAAVLPAVLATVLILAAAGMSAFRSFSVLTSILARDGFLPRQLQSRGDRLVYSNGIVLLGVAAGVLVWAFGARLTDLIQLYVVGVFLALAVGQWGMTRHWRRRLDRRLPHGERRRAQQARAVAIVGTVVTAAVLLVVLVSKFTTGAWVVVLLVPVLAVGMRAIRRHYDTVAYETAAEERAVTGVAHEVTALILMARIHKPTLRALAYARATRPAVLEAVTVAVEGQETADLVQRWEALRLRVPLVVLESPYREINTPVVGYVRSLQRANPERLLTVYVPEFVVDHWWERLLHNQSAARLKRRLTALPNVVVITVPWQRAAERSAAGPGATGGVTGMTAALPKIDADGQAR
jgi:amino acid transporter